MLRTGLIFVIVIVALVCVHRVVLRSVARALIVDQGLMPADAVVVLGGDRGLERSAQCLHEGLIQRVLLLEWHPDLVVRLKIMPSSLARDRTRLEVAGVSEDSMEVLPGQVRTSWEALRSIAAWLMNHPGTKLVVFCGRLDGKRIEQEWLWIAVPALIHRVQIVGLTDREFDEPNWWLNRRDMKLVLGAWNELLLEYWLGELPWDADDWDPDAFEQSLRQSSDTAMTWVEARHAPALRGRSRSSANSIGRRPATGLGNWPTSTSRATDWRSQKTITPDASVAADG